MSRFEEFGPYLLLKKLSEDPLGEVFRAGRVGSDGVDRVVLLRIFNGRTINGMHLWQRVAGRQAVHTALRSPNIGLGVDLGEVRGVPYAAYDYISGKNLRELLVQASTENTPIPPDQALLVAERLALALSVASEARIDDARILHGFAVPHLVMISNEGETRLLGFEAGPALSDLAASGAFGAEITRYLAPELLVPETAGRPERSDDVYSLGVILYEMLTCRPLPAAGAEGWEATLRGATIAQENTPLPTGVAELIARSLAPRGQRLPDAVQWHKAVTKIVGEGGFNATTFNVAFFMHNLFRHEIERESQEIEAEKTLEMPVRMLAQAAAAAAPRAAAAPPPAARAAAPDESSASPRAAVDRGSAGANRTPLFAALGVAAVVLAAGGYYWFGMRGKSDAPPAQTAAASDAALEPVPAEPEVPAGPTPEEIQAQLAQMIEARSAEMEAKLKSQYDERIKQLQTQLEDSQAATERREADARERERLAAERRSAELAAAAAPPKTEPVETAAPKTEPAADAADAAAQPATRPAGATTAPATPPAGAAATRPAEPAPPPAAPKVRLGDLVSFGPGVTPPALVRMPEPTYPSVAKRLNKSGTIEVRVLVDEKGEVLQTELAGEKAGYGLDQAALDAARNATYRPATKDGVRVRMWTVLKVRFTPR